MTSTDTARRRAICVDDEVLTLRLVARLLERMGLDVTPFSDARAALEAFDPSSVDLVVTDVGMPGLDGLSFLRSIRARDRRVPIVVASGQATVDIAVRALRAGATGMLLKPFTSEEFVTEIEAALAQAPLRADAAAYRSIDPLLDGVALAVGGAIETRELETAEHAGRLGVLGESVASLLGLPVDARRTVRLGGYLHDVGKLGISEAILLKPGALTPDEHREMRRHAEIGEAIVRTNDSLAGVAAIVRHHHERWDGSGYPDGLTGAEIPVGARIVAVADAWDAMTSDRVYRWALSRDQAWSELRGHAGTQFDPEVVAAFEEAIAQVDGTGATGGVEARERVEAAEPSSSHDEACCDS